MKFFFLFFFLLPTLAYAFTRIFWLSFCSIHPRLISPLLSILLTEALNIRTGQVGWTYYYLARKISYILIAQRLSRSDCLHGRGALFEA